MTRLATPGVYLVERNAFTSSVVQVPTAVPAFIGYTERAARGTQSLLNKPTRITSLKEYVDLFGTGPKTTFNVKPDASQGFSLKVDDPTRFMMFNSLRLFFANGGGACYIVSVGDYSKGIKASELNDVKTNGGLQALLKEQEPTMVLMPDAVLLPAADCHSLYQAMLKHCGYDMQSRFAILDVHDGFRERTLDDKDVVNMFREGVGANQLAFGAAYYPWVNTTIVAADEIDYSIISNADGLVKLLIHEAERNILGSADDEAPAVTETSPATGEDGTKKAVAPAPKAPASRNVDPALQRKFDAAKAEIEKLKDRAGNKVTEQNVRALSPMFKSIMSEARRQLNVLPPSGGMAGLYSMVDNLVGVHKAPANVSMNSVISPTVNITAEQQEDLNLPLTGKAVNAIRGFIGKGTLVWGARTLDGNSQDWRYVSVRRTVIMIEQSIKAAAEAYVFETNAEKTWLRVRTAIENFLTDVWKSGALMGISSAEAFDVEVGLGSTMTPEDVLDGIMRITVKVCVVRPAEFIVITFQQKMQTGGGGGEEGA